MGKSAADDSPRKGQMRYLAAPARRRLILDKLGESGFLSTTQLVGELDVSDMTVRRDLHQLERAGEVRLVRGGVILPRGGFHSSQFASRTTINADAKRAIATGAADTIKDDDVVAIDAGTTAFGVVSALPAGFSGCIVSHSVPVLQRMLHHAHARTIALGGDLLQSSQAFTGPMTVDAANRLRVQVFILGAAAVDARGVYVEADTERPVKLALMDVADTVILLVDHTKFAGPAPVRLCPLDKINTLVTDRAPSTPVVRSLQATGTTLRVVEESSPDVAEAGEY